MRAESYGNIRQIVWSLRGAPSILCDLFTRSNYSEDRTCSGRVPVKKSSGMRPLIPEPGVRFEAPKEGNRRLVVRQESNVLLESLHCLTSTPPQP